MSKLSYTSGISDVPLTGMTIGDKFDQTVERYPNREALIVRHQNIRWTYSDLKYQVDRCAKALIACGSNKGDRVGIWSPNRSEWTILQFATAKVGVILVNINPAYRLHELKYALTQSGCKMLVLADQFKTSNYSDFQILRVPLYSQILLSKDYVDGVTFSVVLSRFRPKHCQSVNQT